MTNDHYLENKEETSRFYETARGMMSSLNSLFQQGIERLDFGMSEWKNVDKKPSFDANISPPLYPYEEKNYYVNASNNMWYIYLWQGMRVPPAFSELYYVALLDRIKEFKKNNDGFDFNKGIVYANIGVAQAAQMKLDEGFANILKALYEDSCYLTGTAEDNLRKSLLFTQFEDRYVKKALESMISQLNMGEITSARQFLDEFLESLANDSRAFFDYTFAKIMHSREIWMEKENGFTANRLLAYTQDFCLFNETFLKSKFSQQELSTMPRKELGHLISSPKIGVSSSGCGASDMTELDMALPNEMQKQDLKARCFRVLLTLRNYSSHNIGGGSSANYFYAHYEEILKELVRAMCLIKLLSK